MARLESRRGCGISVVSTSPPPPTSPPATTSPATIPPPVNGARKKTLKVIGGTGSGGSETVTGSVDAAEASCRALVSISVGVCPQSSLRPRSLSFRRVHRLRRVRLQLLHRRPFLHTGSVDAAEASCRALVSISVGEWLGSRAGEDAAAGPTPRQPHPRLLSSRAIPPQRWKPMLYKTPPRHQHRWRNGRR
jgi:hypothetical protein